MTKDLSVLFPGLLFLMDSTAVVNWELYWKSPCIDIQLNCQLDDVCIISVYTYSDATSPSILHISVFLLDKLCQSLCLFEFFT